MSRATKATKTRLLTPKESGYVFMPWSCNHYPERSEIVAYLPGTGKHEVIADVRDGVGIEAEVVAGLIARAVNSYEKNHDMIVQMTAALELCLECEECLTWDAEHEAQSLLNRVKMMR